MRRRDVLVVVAATVILTVSIGFPNPSAVAAPVIGPSTIATSPGHVGDPYQVSLSSSGAATWSVISGRLPPGLTLAAGQIAGVPTRAGAFTFVVRAADGSGTATKTYTLFVYPPASGGYETRMRQAIVARDISPHPSDCNHTGYLTYAIATLWLGENFADVNNKLSTLKLTEIGGTPKSCDPRTDMSRNNLMLGLLIRPYMLYNPTSSFFPGMLTATTSDHLVALMWSYARAFGKVSEAPNSWKLFDSENHDAQAESFYFLAAQIFKHIPAYHNRKYADGSTVDQQYKAWHDHWNQYFDERAKRGLFVEVGAPTYHGYTLEAILNIYNFADDPVLREKAGMILDLDFADYAQQELQNIWGGGRSRSYPDESYSGADDSMTFLGQILFGPTAPVAGNNHALVLATSGYNPPPVVISLANGHAVLGSFADVTRRPGNGPRSFDQNGDWQVDPSASVVNYSYCTPDYIMGTAELKPGATHIAPSSQNRWQGIIFNSSAGDRVYPQAAPSNVKATNDAFHSVQNKNVLITEKRDYKKLPTLVYFPITLDNVVEHNGWLFVQEGASYLAVRPAIGTYHWLTAARNHAPQRDERFIELSKATSPIIFEAARSASYSSFDAFQSRIVAKSFKMAGAVLNYTAVNGTKFTFFTDVTRGPIIDGKLVNYAPTDVFNSPFMQSVWGSGKITITNGALRASYDFSNPANPKSSANR